MLPCGRQLLRVHTLKFNPSHSSTRRTLSDAVRRIPTPPSTAHDDGAQGLGFQLSPTRRLSTAGSFSLLCNTRNKSGTVETNSHVSFTDLYAELRRQNPYLLARLPATSYSHILEEAFRNKSNGLIDTICNDIAQFFEGTEQERRKLLLSILQNADLSKLHADTLVPALDILSNTIHPSIIENLARLVADSKDHACHRLIQRLHSLILTRLLRFWAPSGVHLLTYHPPAVVRAAFVLTFKLITSSEDHLALVLFNALCDHDFIPLEAIRHDSSSSDNLNAVVSAALVRASIRWNWKSTAVDMVLHLLPTSQPDNKLAFSLAVDTSYAVLNAPFDEGIRSCVSLFSEMHRLAPVPSPLIQQFYISAAQRKLGGEAAAFYAFSRAPHVRKNHRYPPPQGVALTWLMHYLSTASKKTYLSRVLGVEVVEDNLLVIPQFRARFISSVAFLGYSSIARKLWSRYTIGKDRHLVIGNSALMLRMTSLFTHLIRRAELEHQQAKGHHNIKKAEVLASQLRDFVAFRDHVLWSYYEHYHSLMKAPHTAITSFARACFIAGKVTEGFNAFKVLLQRKEIPDMYDVNVALSAIAQHHPRSAARIIQQIKEKGTPPDAICYATVMHFAQVHKDSALAIQMLHHLCSLGSRQLGMRSVAAAIRTVLSCDEDGTGTSRRRNLHNVMDIIMRQTKNKFLASPQTGKYLVVTSLRAGDPGMAYRFWDLLLRESTEWQDREQVFQRHLISKMIRQHHDLGLLTEGEAERMLERLKDPPTLVT